MQMAWDAPVFVKSSSYLGFTLSSPIQFNPEMDGENSNLNHYFLHPLQRKRVCPVSSFQIQRTRHRIGM